MYKVTIDTNILGKKLAHQLEMAIFSKPIDLAYTSVTGREVKDTDIEVKGNEILETGVWDESLWDHTVWAGDSPADSSSLYITKLDQLLLILSNGGFPKSGNRENLTKGQKNMLRDAMILEVHWREKRDVLVSNDLKAYIGKDESRRVSLEKLCTTKILTFEEFVLWTKTIS